MTLLLERVEVHYFQCRHALFLYKGLFAWDVNFCSFLCTLNHSVGVDVITAILEKGQLNMMVFFASDFL